MRFFASCPRGLEAPLQAELLALGAANTQAVASGVAFEGERRIGYAANLHSRLASRVLMQVAARRYRNADDLYKLANGIDWSRHFGPEHALRVDTSALRSPLRSLNFATLRVKDGIVDRLRADTGERPSIDTRDPDVRVWLFLEATQATLYLDLSGESLFKRGWRAGAQSHGEAPLKENLAAGMLVLSGWTPKQALVDPFCGSGTIPIEAACIAADIAPGLRREFGLQWLRDHDGDAWRALKDEALQRAERGIERLITDGPRIRGSDIDARIIEVARENARAAGLPPRAIEWRVSGFAKLKPPATETGLLLTNPPYGLRISTSPGEHAANRDHVAAMQAVGETLRNQWGGWQAWFLSADPALPAQLRMQPRRRVPLFNGAIECRLLGFEVFAPRERAPAAASASAATDGQPDHPHNQARPAGDERSATERRDDAKPAQPRHGKQVQAAGKQHDAGHEQPARKRRQPRA